MHQRKIDWSNWQARSLLLAVLGKTELVSGRTLATDATIRQQDGLPVLVSKNALATDTLSLALSSTVTIYLDCYFLNEDTNLQIVRLTDLTASLTLGVLGSDPYTGRCAPFCRATESLDNPTVGSLATVPCGRHKLALVRDGSRMDFYLDGRFQGTITDAAVAALSTATLLYLQTTTDTLCEYYDCRVYNRALTQVEIQNLDTDLYRKSTQNYGPWHGGWIEGTSSEINLGTVFANSLLLTEATSSDVEVGDLIDHSLAIVKTASNEVEFDTSSSRTVSLTKSAVSDFAFDTELGSKLEAVGVAITDIEFEPLVSEQQTATVSAFTGIDLSSEAVAAFEIVGTAQSDVAFFHGYDGDVASLPVWEFTNSYSTGEYIQINPNVPLLDVTGRIVSKIGSFDFCDYPTLQAWFDDVRTETDANQWAECYGGSDLGPLDTSAGVDFEPDEDNYMHIYAARGHRHQLKFDTTKAYLDFDNVDGMNITIPFTRVTGLQLRGVNGGSPLYVSAIFAQINGVLAVTDGSCDPITL